MTSATSTSRATLIAIWILRVVVAALFLLAAFAKLTGQPMMVETFAVVGIGQWFRYLTGLMELVGGIAVLIPGVSALGAMLLLLVDIGAFVAQVTLLHEDWIHTVVIAILLIVLIYLQRNSLWKYVGR